MRGHGGNPHGLRDLLETYEKSRLTAEVDESIIHELPDLREKVAKQKRKIDKLKREIKALEKQEKRKSALRAKAEGLRHSLHWLYGDGSIPESIVRQLIAKSAWWHDHPSGRPVRAPKVAEELRQDGDGWVIDFGANRFFPGLAIKKSGEIFKEELDQILAGEPFNREKIMLQLRNEISRCVANKDGNLAKEGYPLKNDDLVFGATSIDVKDVIHYLINTSEIGQLSEI